MKTLRVGSRDSKLAVMQTELVLEQIHKRHPEVTIELVTLKTTGDLILDKTLDKIGGKGLFVKELDAALLEGRIDLSVSSLKDLPMEENPELPVVCYAKRGDARDALVLPENTLHQPVGQNIGSSSARRQLQLKALFPDAAVSSVRGNIVTRLAKLDRGEYSALILASAGLKRAGLAHRISRIFSPEEMLPAAGQGTLAVQARADFDASFFDGIHDVPTMYTALAERAFVRALNGGCSSPIAAYAAVQGQEMKLTGLHYSEASGRHVVRSIVGDVRQAELLGEQLAVLCKKELEE